MKCLIFILAILCLSVRVGIAADDDRWLVVYKQCFDMILIEKEEDVQEVYECWFIDKNTVRVNQGHRLVWIKIVIVSKKEGETGEKYSQIEFDCAGRALYHSREGVTVTEDWKQIQPNWILDDVAPEACKLEASK